MSDFLEVQCPDCQTVMIVRRRDGKVVEVRRPILDESSGDRFEDAMTKVRGSSDAVSQKFEQARAREKEKLARLDALFNENLKRAREEGPIEKPVNPLEQD